jgi:predicted metal-dependent phosphotriesterase family hydrolase
MQPPTMTESMIGSIITFIFVGALYLAYLLGRATERKKIAAAERKKLLAKANAKTKAKAPCQHLDYTRNGSNQYQLRKRCLACGLVFEITDA